MSGRHYRPVISAGWLLAGPHKERGRWGEACSQTRGDDDAGAIPILPWERNGQPRDEGWAGATPSAPAGNFEAGPHFTPGVKASPLEPKAQSARDGLERGSAFWDAGWQWIAEQRERRRSGPATP